MPSLRPHRAALRNETSALLHELGPTVTDVVANLTRSGVRGVPGNGTDCPVARYLHAVVGPDPRVRAIMVSARAVIINPVTINPGRHFWSRRVVVPLPTPVRGFIGDFDRAAYVNLIATDRRPVDDERRFSSTLFPGQPD